MIGTPVQLQTMASMTVETLRCFHSLQKAPVMHIQQNLDAHWDYLGLALIRHA